MIILQLWLYWFLPLQAGSALIAPPSQPSYLLWFHQSLVLHLLRFDSANTVIWIEWLMLVGK